MHGTFKPALSLPKAPELITKKKIQIYFVSCKQINSTHESKALFNNFYFKGYQFGM